MRTTCRFAIALAVGAVCLLGRCFAALVEESSVGPPTPFNYAVPGLLVCHHNVAATSFKINPIPSAPLEGVQPTFDVGLMAGRSVGGFINGLNGLNGISGDIVAVQQRVHIKANFEQEAIPKKSGGFLSEFAGNSILATEFVVKVDPMFDVGIADATVACSTWVNVA